MSKTHISDNCKSLALKRPQKPLIKPVRPFFSSGPCVKHLGFSVDGYKDAMLGRSHRSNEGLEALTSIVKQTRGVLEIPSDYHVAIVPGSASGAIESAIWNLLGARPVTVLSHDVFSHRWEKDVKDSLGLKDIDCRVAPHGLLPCVDTIPDDHDILMNWNGSTSGVMFADTSFLESRFMTANDHGNGSGAKADAFHADTGIVICDITSAAFTTKIPWHLLDAVGFSWQKGLGGEAAHGMLVLSPRAVKRLESYMPSWPIPYVFKLRRRQEFYESLFHEKTLNTPSLLCVHDFKMALDWAESLANKAKSMSSLDILCQRTQNNYEAVKLYCQTDPNLELFCKIEESQSPSTVTLSVTHPKFVGQSMADQYKILRSIVARVSAEGAGYEISNHPSAPPSLRVWCGPTVELEDIKALMPWITWSINTEFLSELLTERLSDE